MPWVRRVRSKGRCFVLLLAMVALLVVYPYVDRPGDPEEIGLRSLTAVVMFSAVYALSRRRKSLLIGALLLLPAMTHNWLHPHHDTFIIMILGMAGVVAFYAFVAGSVLRYVLTGPDITDDKVFGAIDAYLLFGFAFASVYALIDALFPESFLVYTDDLSRSTLTNAELVYFSFCTLTTTGYGDIAPRTGPAQSVAVLEMVVGVLYVAVIIARLVAGVHRSDEMGHE